MDDLSLLGLPLEKAVQALALRGITAQVEWTESPRKKINADRPLEARVIRVTGDHVLAARFPCALDAREVCGESNEA
jgi:hypothetical protein